MAEFNATSAGSDRERQRRPRRVLVSLAIVSVVSAAMGVVPSTAASTFTVSGSVYRDLDNDGVRDEGEPGVPGIRVHRNAGADTPTTVTGPDGGYTLDGLARSSAFLSVETGWFRSQCAQLTCPAVAGGRRR